MLHFDIPSSLYLPGPHFSQNSCRHGRMARYRDHCSCAYTLSTYIDECIHTYLHTHTDTKNIFKDIHIYIYMKIHIHMIKGH